MTLRPTKRQVEEGYPWVGGAAACAVAAAFLPGWVYEPRVITALVDPIVNVAAIAIAFFVAVAVMLGTLKADPLIRELQRIDAFPVLLSYLRSAIYVWGAAIVLSLAVKVVPADAIVLGSLFALVPSARLPRFTWTGALVPVWIAVLVVGGLTGQRVVRVLFGLLRYRDPRLVRPTPAEDDDEDEPLVLPPERRRHAAR